MKIGITSVFQPAVGGMETIARQLAEAFAGRGHAVTVITPTAGDPSADAALSYRVVRRPGARRLLAEVAKFDVVLQMGVMFRTAWAALLTGTPVVVAHHAWLERTEGRLQVLGWLKKRYTAGCDNVVVSRALLTEAAGPAVIVPNGYDDQVFTVTNPGERDRELIFVGRLVSDKGADLLLQALAKLQGEGCRPRLTIIGDGPEREGLERLAGELGLREQVTFLGRQAVASVAGWLNRHRILVVPSRWEEPFGLVALEGMACGCSVVASAGGGLQDLIGPFGRLFPRNDLAGLCAALRLELARTDPGPDVAAARAQHLEQFKPARMADGYLEVLARRAGRTPAGPSLPPVRPQPAGRLLHRG